MQIKLLILLIISYFYQTAYNYSNVKILNIFSLWINSLINLIIFIENFLSLYLSNYLQSAKLF